MAEAPGRRRIRIGVDGRELTGRPTGVGRYLRAVLDEWAETPDDRETIVVYAAGPAPDWFTATAERRWVVLPAAAAGTWWEQTSLPAALRRDRIDVCFAAGYTAPIFATCPTVVAIYDVSFFALPGGFRWREGLRRRLLTRASARRAAAIVTISEFSAGEIVRWLGVPRDRIHLAPPGAPARDSVARDVDAGLVLSVGSLFNRRHLPELIAGFAEAARRVPGAHLTIVGDNRTAPRLDPRALATAAGCRDRIDWREYASDAELAALYRQARAFVFLSDYEGFGMTPLEAAAAGVPAVLQDTAVMREVYGDAALLVAPEPPAIAAAITTLLTDDRAHADVLARARQRLTAFSWARAAATIRDALHRAVRS